MLFHSTHISPGGPTPASVMYGHLLHRCPSFATTWESEAPTRRRLCFESVCKRSSLTWARFYGPFVAFHIWVCGIVGKHPFQPNVLKVGPSRGVIVWKSTARDPVTEGKKGNRCFIQVLLVQILSGQNSLQVRIGKGRKEGLPSRKAARLGPRRRHRDRPDDPCG